MEILGFKINSGNYQGHDYCNVYMYLKEMTDVNSAGIVVKTVKLKKNAFDEFVAHAGVEDAHDVVGLNIDKIYYDRYGNVDAMILA